MLLIQFAHPKIVFMCTASYAVYMVITRQTGFT